MSIISQMNPAVYTKLHASLYVYTELRYQIQYLSGCKKHCIKTKINTGRNVMFSS